MGQIVFILGASGTGKSYSMRNFPKEKLAVINVLGKMLSFGKFKDLHTKEEWAAWGCEEISTDSSVGIVKALEQYAQRYKSIVVDDFQYVMANEFMRRSAERGFDKFTEIGRHAWDVVNEVRSLPSDVIVYILCHTDRSDDGVEKIKTIGRLLDEKICLEGMSTIVLMTNVTDGIYTFLTQNNGRNTVKSPAGMFPSYAIDNDLWYVDQKIRSYYEMGDDHLTEEEMAEKDEEVKKDAPADGKRKSRRKAEAEPVTEETAAEEQPKKRSRRKVDLTEEREAVQKENSEILADAGMEEAGDAEEVPFEEVKDVELKELPKRKSRKKAETETEESPAEAEPAEEPVAEEQPKRRRRRRV